MLREKAIRNYYSGLDEAKQEGKELGLAQGLAQGIQQEKTATIINMLRKGIDIQVIARITPYSVEDIQRIAKENLQSYYTQQKWRYYLHTYLIYGR